MTSETPLLFHCPPLTAWITVAQCERNASEGARLKAWERSLSRLTACEGCPGVRALRQRGETPEPRVPEIRKSAASSAATPAPRKNPRSRVRPRLSSMREPTARTVPTIRSERSHCRNGHALTPENIHVRSSGKRECRTCNREQSLRSYYKNRDRRRKNQARYRERVRERTGLPHGHFACGHPARGRNVRVNADGSRECHRCAKAWETRHA